MKETKFKGKALYMPSGKAAEYSPWACNFYAGCSNDCEYCYCKRGVMSHVWSNEPRLKKCFKDEHRAIGIFNSEMKANLEELQKHGIFFSFTTDPMLPGTCELTLTAVAIAALSDVPVKILTKRSDWLDAPTWKNTEPLFLGHKDKIAFGFTLTGFDEEEPGASLNSERIEAMRELHGLGFKTFASIEPIITPAMSRRMIESSLDCCDLYKVGLMSGVRDDYYEAAHLSVFWEWLKDLSDEGHKIYPKDSLLDYFHEDRSCLEGNFVNSDYNIFQP